MSIYGSNILTKESAEKVEVSVRSFTESEMLAITLEAFFIAESDDDEAEGDDSITEGANLDARKAYKDALKSYKEKIRIANKCIKKANMKEARNYTKSALKEIQNAKKAIKEIESTKGSIAWAWIVESLYIAATVTMPFATAVYYVASFHVGLKIGAGALNLSGMGIEKSTKEFVKSTMKEKVPGMGISLSAWSKICGALSGLINLLADLSTLFNQTKDAEGLDKANVYKAKLLQNLDMFEAEVKKLESKISVDNLGKEKE